MTWKSEQVNKVWQAKHFWNAPGEVWSRVENRPQVGEYGETAWIIDGLGIFMGFVEKNVEYHNTYP